MNHGKQSPGLNLCSSRWVWPLVKVTTIMLRFPPFKCKWRHLINIVFLEGDCCCHHRSSKHQKLIPVHFLFPLSPPLMTFWETLCLPLPKVVERETEKLFRKFVAPNTNTAGSVDKGVGRSPSRMPKIGLCFYHHGSRASRKLGVGGGWVVRRKIRRRLNFWFNFP